MNNRYIMQRLLQNSFARHSDRTAVSYRGKKITYAQLDGKAEQYASLMSELAPDGKCAAMMLRDPLEMICCILAAVKSAINNAGKVILVDHINHCIVDAVQENDFKKIDELSEAIRQFVK